MSRICVKNLPKYVAEEKLRAHFSQKGEITDAKLMRTKDGKSRQFAFIGFRTEQEAQEAIKYFDRSYFDTSRITCELARKVGDPDIPRPWSRHSLKKEKNPEDGKNIAGAKSSGMLSRNGEGKDSKKESESEDPQLQEFLQVMQPRAKSKLWADDTLISTAVEQNAKVSENKNQRKKLDGEKPVQDHIQVEEPDEEEDVSAKEPENIAQDAISDMDYFKSRVKKDWSDSDSGDNSGSEDEVTDDNNDSSQERQEGQKVVVEEQDVDQEDMEGKVLEGSDGEVLDPGNPSSSLKDENDVLETGRLFVRNLPYTTNEDELEELFSKFGNVSQVHLVVNKDTKRSKGIAYVLFSIPECAARALEELDNTIFQGRLLHVLPAKQKHVSEKQETNLNQASKGFKQQREEERKASEASGNTRAWNSLFMRSDTVVENIARKYGVTKSDFLDREADDLAVRIALGETQVIAETKKNLANAGVNVACLEEFAAGKADGIKRSNHVLLVKNLPYSSSENELAKMFRKFGSLDKIIIPPTKTLALVVFLEPSEARAAFRGLAYKRYKDAPLYLEWAPSNILCPSPKSESDNKNQTVGGGDAKRVILEQRVEGIMDEDADPDRIESRSLFVKNINFKTSDESLKKHFSEHIKEGKILSVKIKKHVKNGKTVSMGFGFIEFDSVETATNVCKDLQGSVLDGHALILQICHAKKDEQAPKKAEDGKSSTKILVKNVAFEANEKDLRQLFSPFGQLKSLRLPMKFGNHRGFAFVEYITKQEAKNALEALSNTHLYGRHLVLERAKEGESLEELRARTASQFTDENGTQGPKLSKKRKQMAVLDEGTMKFQRITE